MPTTGPTHNINCMAIKVCPSCFVAEQSCVCSDNQMGSYKEEYEKLRSICSGIYYARIAMRSDLVAKGLDELDNYFRPPNMN